MRSNLPGSQFVTQVFHATLCQTSAERIACCVSVLFAWRVSFWIRIAVGFALMPLFEYMSFLCPSAYLICVCTFAIYWRSYSAVAASADTDFMFYCWDIFCPSLPFVGSRGSSPFAGRFLNVVSTRCYRLRADPMVLVIYDEFSGRYLT